MHIQRYQASQIEEIINLFYNTVHHINAAHYSAKQLQAWAPPEERSNKVESWQQSLQQHITYVAIKDGIIVGFSDMSDDGHLDRLYVHKDYQRQRIASTLLTHLEYDAQQLKLDSIYTEASITAKPFFEHHDFQVEHMQQVERQQVSLTNYVMSKSLG
ncbi:MAG: GNAT family N-acetyltransferase [Candidatus Pristimantibacillus lignocellulolyticus]|uniref:GNAT family N-acetyltransferase n=1 Tax=Candidatus Pristimantibacillus lignocellulolyticus TaxID=2994561 RepID=A0A9J6ZKJ6_9BACL|nr:MAG: GNAT family N-acetyltransferase [Candidatus Pristimantibacillus lignocellulolyticus]